MQYGGKEILSVISVWARDPGELMVEFSPSAKLENQEWENHSPALGSRPSAEWSPFALLRSYSFSSAQWFKYWPLSRTFSDNTQKQIFNLGTSWHYQLDSFSFLCLVPVTVLSVTWIYFPGQPLLLITTQSRTCLSSLGTLHIVQQDSKAGREGRR